MQAVSTLNLCSAHGGWGIIIYLWRTGKLLLVSPVPLDQPSATEGQVKNF